MENFSEPFDALTEIVNEYPLSTMYEDSVFRLGLLNFSFARDSQNPEQYEEEALVHFNKIIENVDSPLYYEALYQRGWVRMNSFDHRAAQRCLRAAGIFRCHLHLLARQGIKRFRKCAGVIEEVRNGYAH